MKRDIRPDKLREECGVFGIFNKDDELDVARLTYYGLYALQHRGQESAGIAINDGGTIVYHKDMGLVHEVFDEVVLNHLKGKSAIGHVRYSTAGASLRENAQPVVAKYRNGQMALAHNGNLVNAVELRENLEDNGAIFQSTADSEVILNLISRYRVMSTNIEETIRQVMTEIQGSYALCILTPQRLVGVRDPLGIRPLVLGKIKNSYVLASETCAFDAIGAEYIRDILPGEIILIGDDGIKSILPEKPKDSKLCVFEFVYFARPDSFMDGASVHEARIEAGRKLAQEYPVDADIVIGAPDSGLTAALGYSMESGIPYAQGLLKNRYVGRTFIQPEQGQRDASVRLKFGPLKSVLEGKRVIMVDDSIVRGTTTKRIVQMLKNAGAKEVHMRISSPPIKHPCYFGIDTPSRQHLVAASQSMEEIRQLIGADSLGYLSKEGLLDTPVEARCGFCTACFDGNYPMEIPDPENTGCCG